MDLSNLSTACTHLLRCLTKMADCDLWHSVSSTLGSGLGSLLVPGEVPGEVWQSGSSTWGIDYSVNR